MRQYLFCHFGIHSNNEYFHRTFNQWKKLFGPCISVFMSIRVCHCAKSHRVHVLLCSTLDFGPKWYTKTIKLNDFAFFNMDQALRSLCTIVI